MVIKSATDHSKPIQGQTRREVIRFAATGALAGLLPESLGHAAPRKPLNIIIIGAGMAGLCAAYELEKRGHSVTILEAEPTHLGGRVRTLHFTDGQYGELGAMRIPANHHLTRKYISAFGLPLRPFIQYNPEAYYYVHGARTRIRQTPHMSHEVTLGMDGRSASEWSQRFDEIPGGMDALAAAFVSRLRARPKQGCAVTRIVQDHDKRRVAAIYKETSGTPPGRYIREQSIYADFLLCTVPLPVLRHLKIEPELPPDKRRAMSELPYNAANKVLIDVNHRFWESGDHIFGGATYTDLPTEFTYYPSDNSRGKDPRISAGPGVLLASYTIGKPALKFDALSPTAAAHAAVESLSAVHPQLAGEGMVRKSISWSWDNHTWSRGGFAAPGKRMDLGKALSSPEGRIFFAGEHLSQHRTWIQGALESALVAVHQILTAA